MRYENGSLTFSPSDLITFFESPFASFMDRLSREQPGHSTPAATDRHAELIARKGDEHERAVLDRLRSDGLDVCEIAKDADAEQRTVQAIRDGRQVIYQAALAHDGFAGFADFLFREDDPSPSLGWTYRVADTKLARKAKPYFLLQLCAYSEMLAPLQGRRSPRVEVITGDGAKKQFRTDDYYFYFQSVKRAFLAAQDRFDPTAEPIPDPAGNHRKWEERATEVLARLDHPCRTAGITRQQMRRLADAGITTLNALATTKLSKVPQMAARTYAKLRAQARLQVAAIGREVPPHELIPAEELDDRLGLALLPPASKLDVWFDMEGFPLVEGGHEYLFGACHHAKGELAFKDVWALSIEEERRAFETFIDWVYERFRQDPSMHVYHYAAYEVTACKRLMGKYGSREQQVDELLRARVFVDLFQVLRQSIRVGTESYSIKYIERLYRPPRAAGVATAADSVVEFAAWREVADGGDWKSSGILRGIRDYNKDDCESTWQLTEWLRERQREAGIVYRADWRGV